MALAILVSLVGYSVGVKIYTILKVLGIKVENMTQQELEELLKDKRFQKYMR